MPTVFLVLKQRFRFKFLFRFKFQDKASGKSQRIVVTSDKGRLSPEEIERMIKDAEENADKDKELKERIESRNSLESYLYNLKSQIEDKEKLASKLTEDDKSTISKLVSEGIDWLDSNQTADREMISSKQKEIEEVCNPIVAKVYQNKEGNSSDSEDLPRHDDL